MRVLLPLLLLVLAGCASKPQPIKTQIVEVPVETVIPLSKEMTARIPPPARPALACVDAKGRDTLCNKSLESWLRAYDAVVQKLNNKLEAIESLQPKPDPSK